MRYPRDDTHGVSQPPLAAIDSVVEIRDPAKGCEGSKPAQMSAQLWRGSDKAIGRRRLGYHPAMSKAPTGTLTLVFTERARDNTEYREIPVILPI